jgi:hypothetical protein
MKNISGTVFLVFVVVLLAMLGVAVVWISQNAGWEMALGIGMGCFIVLILFAQQILTGLQVQETTNSLVSYDEQQAKVKEQEMRAQVIYAQSMREAAKVQNQISADQYKVLMATAQKMAGYLSDAEIAKIKAEMMGMGVLPDNQRSFELD